MHNRHLDERTARDIDTRVHKVLRDLGDPEPPLRLELVRDVLELDRAYYSSTDHGVLKETVHRLKMAGKQVIRRPYLLVEVVQKLKLKDLWVPDRNRILIDAELPSAKQRWGEAHEIGHSLLPWHESVMHGDQNRTLSYACQRQIEAEANFAAGRMLFLQDVFVDHLQSGDLSFDRVREISKHFGNTITSTLWRSIESLDEPNFGLVSQHPRRPVIPDQKPIRYFLRSRAFETQFSTLTAQDVFRRLRTFCFGRVGPIGSDEQIFRDANGDEHTFYVETFFNHHDALTLGTYRAPKPKRVVVTKSVRTRPTSRAARTTAHGWG